MLAESKLPAPTALARQFCAFATTRKSHAWRRQSASKPQRGAPVAPAMWKARRQASPSWRPTASPRCG